MGRPLAEELVPKVQVPMRAGICVITNSYALFTVSERHTKRGRCEPAWKYLDLISQNEDIWDCAQDV